MKTTTTIRLKKCDREMSREGFDRLTWEINNIREGVARRESGRANASDLEDLKKRLEYKIRLRDTAIILCDTDAQKNIIAENSWK